MPAVILFLFVHSFDDFGIVFHQHVTFNLQRIGNLALVKSEWFWHEGEVLYLLISSQCLLQCGYSVGYQGLNLLIAAQFLTACIGNVVVMCILFKECVDRHDECRDILALVSHDSNLLYILVDKNL